MPERVLRERGGQHGSFFMWKVWIMLDTLNTNNSKGLGGINESNRIKKQGKSKGGNTRKSKRITKK
jgi:hypothetical protein